MSQESIISRVGKATKTALPLHVCDQTHRLSCCVQSSRQGNSCDDSKHREKYTSVQVNKEFQQPPELSQNNIYIFSTITTVPSVSLNFCQSYHPTAALEIVLFVQTAQFFQRKALPESVSIINH